MKRLLLFLSIILPTVCGAQEYLSGKLAENRVDENTHDTIRRSYWQVLERTGISKKLNTFYRISRINSDMYMDLKVTEGGGTFAVARNAPLKLMLENGNIITLYNSKYQVSCKGCGSRKDDDNRAQGVSLSFPVSSADVYTLRHHYIAAIGINTGNDYLEKRVNETHSELLMDEIRMVYHSK